MNLRGGDGTGELSSEAEARLSRIGPAILRPPPISDLDAVARWRREVHDGWLAGDRDATECGHTERVIAGVRCLVATSHKSTLTMYLHGGGYALGSPEVALPITERLARWTDLVSADYRLAPEHPFPAARDDCLAVYGQLRTANPDRRLVIGGDSAGANLAVATTLAAHRAGLDGPDALVLFSPHLDHKGGPRVERASEGTPRTDVDSAAQRWLRDAYCGSLDSAEPAVSPLRDDLGVLPPTLVQVGTADPALPDAVRLTRVLRLSERNVTLDVWDGLWHTWHYHRDLPEADRALAEAGAFIASGQRR